MRNFFTSSQSLYSTLHVSSNIKNIAPNSPIEISAPNTLSFSLITQSLVNLCSVNIEPIMERKFFTSFGSSLDDSSRDADILFVSCKMYET